MVAAMTAVEREAALKEGGLNGGGEGGGDGGDGGDLGIGGEEGGDGQHSNQPPEVAEKHRSKAIPPDFIPSAADSHDATRERRVGLAVCGV